MPFCWFCHEAAHICLSIVWIAVDGAWVINIWQTWNSKKLFWKFSLSYCLCTSCMKTKWQSKDVCTNEPSRVKTNKVSVCPAKTQISLCFRPVWSESSLSAWRKLEPLATQWAHSEDSGQTGWMPRLIWVFAGRTATLLVLSRGGSNAKKYSFSTKIKA